MVITDLRMPNMDGITLVSELRKLPDFRTTPMLMLTTEATPSRKQAGREAGASTWIVKPFEQHQLIEVIRSSPY